MIGTYVIGLEPIEDCFLDIWPGRALHALFLKLIQSENPVLSEILHAPNGLKPFTVSGVQGEAVKNADGITYFLKGKNCWFRLTSLHNNLTIELKELINRLPNEIQIYNSKFKVKGVQEFHPLTRETSYHDLVEEVMNGAEHISDKIELNFCTPTAFSKTNEPISIFPWPKDVFGSLFDRWQAFSPLLFEKDIKGWINSKVSVCRYDLHSRHLKIKEIKNSRKKNFKIGFTGFVGSCHFLVNSNDPYMIYLLNLLAEYSFFAGVGKHTAFGLGQASVVREPNKYDNKNSKAAIKN